MQTYTELTPPTAVSHCAAFPFTTAKATNLIVAKTSLLQIFDLVTITTEAAPADDQTSAQDIAADTLDRTFFSSDITLQRLETTTKLSLVAEYPLAGTVTSLGGVRIPGTKTGGAALVAAFRDAKLSLIEWDPERRAISTLSLHYFEHGLHISPWAPALAHCPAHLAVDPGQRCVLLRFGPRHIAILPFRRPGDDAADDAIEDVAGDQEQLPYKPSFVLPLTVLDPEIVFPSHLAFLHEYGEPTFGILSSIRAPSSAMSLERRDVMNYKVFTLDLDQKAVTTILSVPKLPTDLHQVVALPLPVGGSLLVGTNEVVHVDQSGNSFAVAVNSFARQSSLFPMADQSRLEMKLESCTLEPIGEHGELLMILQSGALALLSFAMEGRSVNNIRIQKVPSFQVVSGVSCLSALGRNRLFLGGEDNNSVILGWNRTSASSAQAQPATEENSEDDEEDYDDDDLYGGGAKLSKSHSRTLAEPLEADALAFRIHDALPNHAPTGEIALGKASPTESVRQMVYPVGRDRSGGLAVCRRQIDPLVRKTLDFTGANAVFAFHASGEGDAEAALSADAAWDQYLLVSRTVDGDEESALYAVARGKASRIERGEFEGEGGTVEVGVMGGGGRMVQVQSAEIRCYNSEFGLEQIFPMSDGDAEDLKVVSCCFCDPYLLVLRDDLSAMVLKFNAKSKELDEMDLGEGMSGSWISGCIYTPAGQTPLVFLLNEEGGLRVFELPNLSTPVYSTDAFPLLPSLVTDEFVPRRYVSRESLSEVIMADIGDDTAKTPYLLFRTGMDDLVIYQAFHPQGAKAFTTDLRWTKVSQPRLAKPGNGAQDATKKGYRPQLRHMRNVGGYSTVFQGGANARFVLKEASSAVRVVPLNSEAMTSVSPLNASYCEQGFALLDGNGVLSMCQFPPQFRYGDTGWPTRQIPLGQEVSNITYFEDKDVYVIATMEDREFKLPDDDHHKEWQHEDTTLPPITKQGHLKIVRPSTWTVIHTLTLQPGEVCLALTSANLESSEKTRERGAYVCAGTATVLGEDQATRGHIYILDVREVVPEPDDTEKRYRFREAACEDVKGAVSQLAGIGPRGFLLVAQGQKCMVRGLVEADKLLPVAFLDTQCYVTAARVLEGESGMAVLGDVAKGVWFVGYTEEPYKIVVFGKSAAQMEVTAVEFLPHEKQLYILAADSDKYVHVLQYDPENPRTQAGRRLLHRSSFFAGHLPTSMHLLPRTASSPASPPDSSGSEDSDSEDEKPQARKAGRQVLIATQTGALALMTPVDETTHLRLSALQTFLLAQLEQPCGLNARGYRSGGGGSGPVGESAGGEGREGERGGGVVKGVVDGGLLGRWMELSKQRRAEGCSRVGVDEGAVRRDLEMVNGSALELL